jgi:hypothetical protein
MRKKREGGSGGGGEHVLLTPSVKMCQQENALVLRFSKVSVKVKSKLNLK